MRKLYGKGFGPRDFGAPKYHYGGHFWDVPKFQVARQMELESILLLKNENSALPLSENDTVTLLGNGVIHTNTGGGGSGGGMGAFSISFLDAMDEKKLPYTAAPTDYYRQKFAEGKGAFDAVHGWDDSDEELWGAQQFSNTGWNNAAPIAVPELKLSDEMMDTAAAGARTAILFLSRTVGCEEMDRGIPRPSDWYLNPSEEQLITQAVTRFDKVILVINSSGSIDFSWMERLDPEKKIGAIVLSYGAGSYYGDVLADLLYGKENFSAKLPDTITRTIEAHHTFRNFGGQQSYAHNGAKPGFADNGRRFMTRNGENDPVGIYQEYVYMGYRYFDTFRGSSDDVLFPFGYGLSYSTFCYKDASVSRKGDTITVEVTVENTSSVPGKAVAEIYISNPNNGKLDQPYQRLMTFAKTKVLSGGESQRVSASFTVHHMSSYSEDLAAYVLEPGKHLIRLGDSSRSTSVCGAIEVEELIVVEQLKNRLTLDNCNPDGDKSNQAEFDSLRLNSQRESDTIGNAERDAEQLVGKTVLTLKQSDVDTVYTLGELPVYVPGQAPEDHTATLQAVVNGELSLSDYVAQLTDFELACIMDGGAGVGNVISTLDDPNIPLTTEKSKPSEPNSYSTGAGTSRNNSRIGFPSLSYCDGSNGIILGHAIADKLKTDPNPGYPKAPGNAASWNQELHAAWGAAVASEMHAANVDVWLAPSINLHRNPLNGRNTEYFSEDPMLTGIIARNVVTSVGDAGLTVCCKHFAGNDQEQFRRGRHTRHSEAEGTSLDAINTITSERALREITLKPFELAVRTGKVYSVMSAFNKINGQYCSASRELLTDILRGEWGFRGFVVTDWGDYDEIPNGAREMAAGNDVIMSGVHTRYSIAEEVFAGVADGTLKREQLLNNAENLLRTILHSKNIFSDGKFRTSCIGESDVQYHKTTALQIKTTMMPPAIIGRPYEELKKTPLFVSGDEDTTRYTWSISPNSAVSAEEFAAFGLTLHGNGCITGCANVGTAGDYDVTFRVTSDLGYADKTLRFSIREITIMPEVLPEVRLGIAYEETIQAFCGEANVKLSVKGTLPKGLSFNAETGLLSGMPEEAGMYEPCSFTICADGETVHGERTYQLRTENYIDVAFTPAGGITVEAGNPIRIPYKTTRGIHAATYDYSLIGAPEGIHLAGMRFIGYWIEGVLLQPGVYNFSLRAHVEDSLPAIIVDAPYTITVIESGDKPLTVDPVLPNGKVTELYAAQVGVSGGKGVKKFSLLPGKSSVNLPADFVLTASGEIRCAPQASESGLYTVCVQVTDEIGSTVEAEMNLYIAGLLRVEPQSTMQFRFAAGEAFDIALSAAGGFNNQFSYRALSALPAGVELLSNPDYTGNLRGTLNKGSYRIVIEVDEVFGGSPVTTVVYYDLIVE